LFSFLFTRCHVWGKNTSHKSTNATPSIAVPSSRSEVPMNGRLRTKYSCVEKGSALYYLSCFDIVTAMSKQRSQFGYQDGSQANIITLPETLRVTHIRWRLYRAAHAATDTISSYLLTNGTNPQKGTGRLRKCSLLTNGTNHKKVIGRLRKTSESPLNYP